MTSSHVQSILFVCVCCVLVWFHHLMLVHKLKSFIHILFGGILSHGKRKCHFTQTIHHFQVDHSLSHFLNLLNRPSSNLNLQVAIAKSFWKPMAFLFASQTCHSSRQKCPKTSFRKRCLSMVKQQKTRFYILGRCISMLLCWHAHSLADWMARLCVQQQSSHSTNTMGCNWRAVITSRS